jgi:hypothetical protein
MSSVAAVRCSEQLLLPLPIKCTFESVKHQLAEKNLVLDNKGKANCIYAIHFATASLRYEPITTGNIKIVGTNVSEEPG